MIRAAALAAALTLTLPAHAVPCVRASSVVTGEPAPCDGVLTPTPWAVTCARMTVELDACRRDATELERRVAVPLPQPCTPVVLPPAPSPPAPATPAAQTAWLVAVGVAVVGFAAGVVVAPWLDR